MSTCWDSSAHPTCFMGSVKQREMAIDLKHREQIAGKILQATASGHDWFSLVVDSGASRTSTPHKSDFVEFHPSSGLVMDGIAEGCTIDGEGVCEFGVVAEDGTEITLQVQAYFVPSLGSGNRLLSPQGIKTTDGNCGVGHQPCNVDDPSVTGKILIKPNVPGWHDFDVMPIHVIQTPYHPRTNLPTVKAFTSKNASKRPVTLLGAVDVATNNNKNMSEAAKELLRLHFRLGHVNFKTLAWMIRSGKVQVRNPKSVANVYPFPKCAACEFGKACRQGSDATSTKRNPDKEMELKKGDLFAGQ